MKKRPLSGSLDDFGIPEFLFEMSNVRKTTTGLPVNIWSSPMPKNWRKGLRIKVSNSYSNRVDPDQAFVLYLDGDAVKVEGDTGAWGRTEKATTAWRG